MTYTWAGNSASGNAYRIRPINALGGSVNFEPTNPRPTLPVDVSGTLRVGALNLLNYFNTFDGLPDNVDNCRNGVGGVPTDCRGADTQAEFDRQYPKSVAAILAMNTAVTGVNEIENDGYGPDSAIQHLVDQLNAATAPGTYAFINVDANTGQINALGTDAIKVGLLYQPALVTPVGVTAALNSRRFCQRWRWCSSVPPSAGADLPAELERRALHGGGQPLEEQGQCLRCARMPATDRATVI